jgi:hypothetical protein
MMSKVLGISVLLLAMVVASAYRLAGAHAAAVQTQIVSQAVGQADEHVVTSREVQISWIIDKAMQIPVAKKAGEAAPNRSDWMLKIESAEFQKHLSQVLLELVVSLEAENFSVGQVTSAEIQNGVNQVKSLVDGWEPWKALEVSHLELEQFMTRKLKARRFLKFKTDTSGVRVSDEDAKAYYEKNRVKFGNLPFAQFKAQIKEYLSQEALQDRLKDWFEILKRKYRVKLLGT